MADVVIVGGGSAGCVLAARLSEDDRCGVLLLEAGPDCPDVSALPPDVVDASVPTEGHDWGYVSEPDSSGRSIALPRGRLMGGCSATNGCFAMRGHPDDYDGWARAGNPGWSFEEVLPFFRRLEADADFQDLWHGTDGPIPIRRAAAGEMNDVQAAFLDSARAVGLASVDDHNRPGAAGAGPMPRNVRDGVRMSTAVTYLAGARGRPNLTVQDLTAVDRVEIRNGRATGIRLVTGEVIGADRVVLAAGAYASPAILLRSGIGPAGDLAGFGIPVHVDLPGVGENLIDHTLLAVDLPARPGTTGPRFQAIATLRSPLKPPGSAPDLHLFTAGPFDVGSEISPSGGIFGVVTGLVRPRSRGRVRLRSSDPSAPPRIDVAHLRHPDDLARMLEGLLLARRISRTEPLSDHVTGPELFPGPAVADSDREILEAAIRSRVATYHHPVGTCRMGGDPDGGAVVNARGGVHGVDQLVVADASVMPDIPSANTNLPTIMVAERLAEWWRAG